MSKTKTAGLGSTFADFLDETGERVAISRDALKRVVAWQLETARAEQGLTKAALAEKLNTSRSQLDRLLDPANADVTLAALERVAHALGRSVRLELAEDQPKLAKRSAKAPARGATIVTVKAAAGKAKKTPLAAKAVRRTKAATAGARGAMRAAKKG